jgi:uncharacterized protein YecE (DUF72 family)
MQVYCGVSGFSYREWRGIFYPKGLRPEAMLPFYAHHLRTTELNNTFYRMPTGEQLAGWAAQVPPEFVFAVKAPKTITHIKRLLGVEPFVRDFLTGVQSLGERLGPLLFQLPPNLKADLPRLDEFLGVLTHLRDGIEFRVAMEFRHPSWFSDEVLLRLERAQVALVVGDDDELESPPLVATASFGYVRLRKTAPYDAVALAEWAQKLKSLPVSDLFVFFRHESHAPEQAVRFRAHFTG